MVTGIQFQCRETPLGFPWLHLGAINQDDRMWPVAVSEPDETVLTECDVEFDAVPGSSCVYVA